MGRPKKEEIPEDIPEEIKELDLESEPTKKDSQEFVVQDFLNEMIQWRTTIEGVISVNQKYIKGLWERLKIAEDNLKLHLEES